MTKEKLALAKNEAKELIRRIVILERESAVTLEKYNITNRPRESGAVRRQSMELTRALAALRRP